MERFYFNVRGKELHLSLTDDKERTSASWVQLKPTTTGWTADAYCQMRDGSIGYRVGTSKRCGKRNAAYEATARATWHLFNWAVKVKLDEDVQERLEEFEEHYWTVREVK